MDVEVSKSAGPTRALEHRASVRFQSQNFVRNTEGTIVINRTGQLNDEAVLNYSLFTHDQGEK